MASTERGATSPVRVRIAPSPTGPFHIGTARTALFNALFARHHGGTYIVRVEDTDAARSTSAFESDILAGLRWLGLEGDEGVTTQGELGDRGPYRQSARTARYAEVAASLHDRGLAYYCFCTPAQLDEERAAREAARLPPRYSNRCRSVEPDEAARRRAAGEAAALRFRIPEGPIVVDDLVRGRVEIDAETLGGDLVILRADGSPLYHFTVVVDDVDMGITHVIRGEDHLSNTPKHILLFRALGATLPAFAHLPLILNSDRTKMSKRKSQTALADYRAEGFLPEALVNFLALLGWSTGNEEEVLSVDELVARFDLGHVQKAGAVFDRARLEWLNGQWIRRLEQSDLAARLRPLFDAATVDGRLSRAASDAEIAALVPLIRERIQLLSDAVPLTDFLFTDGSAEDASSLVPKRWDAATTREGGSRAISSWPSAWRSRAERRPRRSSTACDSSGDRASSLGSIALHPDSTPRDPTPIRGPFRAGRASARERARGTRGCRGVSATRILLVEDERALRNALADALSAEGFAVRQAETGADGLAMFRAEPPDLILLDLMLPEMGGVEVCRAVRSISQVPIIMVTAKASEVDRILGLDLGADDYVTKPFSARELVARIRAVLRRAASSSPVAAVPAGGSPLVRVGVAEVDLEGQRILRNGTPVHLKPKAFQLLAFLVENAGRVYTREQLLDRVWGYDYAGETRTVDVHVHALRQAIESDPGEPVAIQTIRNIGYVLRRPA